MKVWRAKMKLEELTENGDNGNSANKRNSQLSWQGYEKRMRRYQEQNLEKSIEDMKLHVGMMDREVYMRKISCLS